MWPIRRPGKLLTKRSESDDLGDSWGRGPGPSVDVEVPGSPREPSHVIRSPKWHTCLVFPGLLLQNWIQLMGRIRICNSQLNFRLVFGVMNSIWLLDGFGLMQPGIMPFRAISQRASHCGLLPMAAAGPKNTQRDRYARYRGTWGRQDKWRFSPLDFLFQMQQQRS